MAEGRGNRAFVRGEKNRPARRWNARSARNLCLAEIRSSLAALDLPEGEVCGTADILVIRTAGQRSQPILHGVGRQEAVVEVAQHRHRPLADLWWVRLGSLARLGLLEEVRPL